MPRQLNTLTWHKGLACPPTLHSTLRLATSLPMLWHEDIPQHQLGLRIETADHDMAFQKVLRRRKAAASSPHLAPLRYRLRFAVGWCLNKYMCRNTSIRNGGQLLENYLFRRWLLDQVPWLLVVGSIGHMVVSWILWHGMAPTRARGKRQNG